MVPTTLRQMSGRHRSEAGDTRLGVALAFVAGAVNAGGFLAVGTYTSHMSGMASSLSDFLAQQHWQAAALAAMHITAFFLGSLSASLMVNGARRYGLNSEFAIALLVEAVLLLAFGFLAAAMAGPAGLQVLISLLCLIMGLQNGLITKISHAEIRTTHMTGVITDLGIEAGRWLFAAMTGTAVRFDGKKTRRLAALLAAFLSGGVIGALAFGLVGYISVAPLCLILVVLAAMPIADDLARFLARKP